MAGLRCLGGEIGRRTGLKIPWSNIRAGSTPARGTNKFKGLQEIASPFLLPARLQGEALLGRLDIFLLINCNKKSYFQSDLYAVIILANLWSSFPAS